MANLYEVPEDKVAKVQKQLAEQEEVKVKEKEDKISVERERLLLDRDIFEYGKEHDDKELRKFSFNQAAQFGDGTSLTDVLSSAKTIYTWLSLAT